MVLAHAWDKSALVEELKAQGLPVAEMAAKKVVEVVLDWASASVLLSEEKYDDFAVPVIGALKPFIMSEIDKIDGKPGV